MFTEEFDLFVEDFLGEKFDRPLIIIGAAKIDDLLSAIIAKFLLEPIKPKEDDLLNGDRPLSTFSSRIKLSYRLGIIDKKLLDSLEILRKLRNSCAHEVTFNLKKSPVKDHFLNLRNSLDKRDSFSLTKDRYFSDLLDSETKELQCLLITLCVILQAIKEKIVKTSPIKSTIQISNK